MPLSIAAVNELRLSGRFSVTDSTPSASSTERSSMLVYASALESMVVMSCTLDQGPRPEAGPTWLYK